MTLNITVATERVIYQCADCRFTDWKTGGWTDIGNLPKLHFVSMQHWHATVCFNGVGYTDKVNVSDWLAQTLITLDRGDPIDALIEKLLTADAWLVDVPERFRKHSFVVGAFVGSAPRVVLVSNYERFFELPLADASKSLSTFTFIPTGPKTFVQGQRTAIHGKEQNRLAAMANANATTTEMFAALAEANRTASLKNTAISAGCFTCFVARTGEAGGAPHGIVASSFGGMPGSATVVKKLLDDHFGPGKYAVRQFAAVKAEDTDDYHETRLRDKPNDSETHSNYGNYLLNSKNDVTGAEREYLKALELDPKNANALGNLANVKWRNGEIDAARTLYQSALQIAPQHENVTWCYGKFLISQNDRAAARQVLNRGIDSIQEKRRLRLALANLDLLDRNVATALEAFRLLREQGADQKEVECGFALALQMSGAPIDQCVDTYRTAVALSPESGGLLLNLAQLLLARGSAEEGERKLHEALRLELDPSAGLEAQFYLLAHTEANSLEVFDAIRKLRAKGARLDWDVQPNIDAVRTSSVESADILALLANVLAQQDGSASIDPLVKRWENRPVLKN